MRAQILPSIFLMLVLLIGFPSSAVNFSVFADDEDDDNDEIEIEGEIDEINLESMFFTIVGSILKIFVNEETEFDEGFDSLDDLAPGFHVEVDVVLSNGSHVATEIEVEDDDDEEEKDNKIEICHIPKGNPSNAHTISVGMPAGKAHLSHGDLEGACEYDHESTIDKWEEKYSKKLKKLEDKRAKLEQKQIELAQKYAEKLGKLESKYADKQSKLTEKQTLKLERLSEKLGKLESKYIQKSAQLLEKFNQKFNKLDERSQKLVEKFNSGEYFGESDITEYEIHEIVLRFDSLMGESFIDSSTSNFVADITLEASSNISSGHQKFKVTGCQIIGDEVSYHCAFGKARTISLGTGNNNGLDIVAFLEDDNSEATSSLRAHVIPLDSSAIWLQEDTTEVTMNAKISLQWTLSGDGTLTNSTNEDKDGDNEEN